MRSNAHARAALLMHSILQDLRIAGRRFKREPAFVALASATLALGIGFTTAVFGIVQSVLFDPVPYVDGTDIVVFEIRNPASPTRGDRRWLTARELVEYRAGMSALGEVAAISSGEEVLYSGRDGTERLSGASVSENAFQFLGVAPALGRALTVGDAASGNTPVFVMSHRMWRALGSDAALLQRTFVLDGVATTLVGVMPERFQLGRADLWRPVAIDGVDSASGSRAFEMYARLARGASLDQAEAQFRSIALRLAPDTPRLYPKNFVAVGMTLVDRLSGKLRPTLRLFVGAVVLLLLIACANVASMLLSRATVRAREMSVRSALGATRSRLIRQLLLESALLALVSAAAGALLAHVCLRAFKAFAPDGLIPPEAVLGLNVPVLMFNLATAAATVVIFGLLPAYRVVGRGVSGLGQVTGRTPTVGVREGRINASIVVVAVTLSIVLLTGAGLLTRTFANLQAIELGLNATSLQFYQIRFPSDRYRAAAEKQRLVDQVLASIRALPGVATAAVSSAVPLDGGVRTGFAVPGMTPDAMSLALVQLVSDGYFDVVGLHMRSGRALSQDDVRGSRKVAVVNETLAKQYFPIGGAVGKHVGILSLRDQSTRVLDDALFEIVGVVADTRNHGLQNPTIPEAFVPSSISGAYGRSILIRPAGKHPTPDASVARELWAVDRALTFARTGSVEDILTRASYAEPRFNMLIVVVFAAMALTLVALGIYGVIAYAVSRQTHDLGVRMALGAPGGSILWMVLRSGLLLVGMGTVCGLALSVAIHRVAESQLWRVPSYDPLTLVVVAFVVLAVGAAACFIPARRALRVDPRVALRTE